MNQNKVIRNLADACLELDRLQVELCKETPYPIPNSEETRDRILEVMNYLEVVAKEVGLTNRKVKEVRKVHIVQDPYHFIDGGLCKAQGRQQSPRLPRRWSLCH